MRDGDGDLVGRYVDFLDTAQLVGGFFLADAVQDEASLGVKEQTEAIARLFQFDHVHKAGGVVGVRSYLSVDLDASFHGNLHAFLAGQCVFKAFTEDNADGQALTQLVGSGRGLGGPDAPHLAQVPVVGRIQSLQMFLGSTSPVNRKIIKW